jgi:DNA polymerase-3 subunit epsilon
MGLLANPNRLGRRGLKARACPTRSRAPDIVYDKHRAVNDCLAAIELLAAPLPVSAVTGLSQLLENARRPTWRIWAESSPFDLKDILKARGYRWNPDGTPFPKACFIDVSDNDRETELVFLQQEIYQRDIQLLTRKIDAFNRFSTRV